MSNPVSHSDNLDESEWDWQTADGQKLKYSEMTTSHIKNCITMLRRTLSERPNDYGGASPDDSDGSYWAQVSEERHNAELENTILKQIEIFKEELKHREPLAEPQKKIKQ